MRSLFWLLTASVVYCYFGYPFFLAVMARFFPRRVRKEKYYPSVSVVLSVWNEADVLDRKIRNLVGLNYPPDKLEFLIASDASTDRSNEILQKIGDSRFRIFVNPVRQGKMRTINALVAEARNEIVFFTDARQILASDALQELAFNFADPEVGCVSGELMFSKGDTGTSRGVNLYWNYEKFIRRQESRIHSMLGATGAIYAIRRNLFVAGPEDAVLDDMVIPFLIIRQGYRAVFDPAAKACDEVAQSSREEYRRKARTLYGNYQLFLRLPGMFNPLKSPIAWQLFSHKFLRLLMPFVLVGLFLVNMNLTGAVSYRVLYVLQCVFYLMAIAGILATGKKYAMFKLVARVCYLPQVFCLLNFSAVAGLLRFLFTGQRITWEKARRQ